MRYKEIGFLCCDSTAGLWESNIKILGGVVPGAEQLPDGQFSPVTSSAWGEGQGALTRAEFPLRGAPPQQPKPSPKPHLWSSACWALGFDVCILGTQPLNWSQEPRSHVIILHSWRLPLGRPLNWGYSWIPQKLWSLKGKCWCETFRTSQWHWSVAPEQPNFWHGIYILQFLCHCQSYYHIH